jgi:hypothetical protein
MKHSPAYWGVKPNFNKIGEWHASKRNAAREWCKENCQGRYISSDLGRWAFENETDANNFASKYDGDVKYKPEEWIDGY